jgi:hypothetical protein
MKNCDWCGKREAEFEILVFELQEIKGKLGRWVSGEGHRKEKYAGLFVCGKCLPMKKVRVKDGG